MSNVLSSDTWNVRTTLAREEKQHLGTTSDGGKSHTTAFSLTAVQNEDVIITSGKHWRHGDGWTE